MYNIYSMNTYCQNPVPQWILRYLALKKTTPSQGVFMHITLSCQCMDVNTLQTPLTHMLEYARRVRLTFLAVLCSGFTSDARMPPASLPRSRSLCYCSTRPPHRAYATLPSPPAWLLTLCDLNIEYLKWNSNE